MNKERIYKVILAPIVSEKTTMVGELANQYGFRVMKDATKAEVKAAIEHIYSVSVDGVQVLNMKGKTKRTRYGIGRRNDWKKAYVRLAAGQNIDFAVES